MKPVRVLIVEDSAVVREHLRRIISSDSRLTVAGIAASGEEALGMVDQAAPDVISMDIQLPGMQGFETTRRIMAHRPTPIVVVSGIGSAEVNLTMEALKAGALGVVQKPVASSHEDYEALAARLCTQLLIMSEVKVIRRREMLARGPEPRTFKLPAIASGTSPFRVLAVAASTGGPNALLQLLGGLGDEFPLPVAIVQHLTPGFVEGFAEWLTSVTRFQVQVVTGTTLTAPGTVYLAPSNQHLIIEGGRASLDGTGPVGGHRPSANVLFASVARSCGPRAIGVLLTGMGEDGASGLCEIKLAEGYTIAEDDTTAVVYGMPAAAIRLGAVREALPLPGIAARILELIHSREGGGELKRILLIEDSLTQAARLQQQLASAGFQFEHVSSAEEAFERLAASRPDAIVVDYHLPGKNGDEFCREIKADVNTRAIPVLMLTVDESDTAQMRGLGSGADDYVAKSADPEILRARLSALLREPHGAGSIVGGKAEFKPARVLAIDDSPTFLYYVKHELKRDGYVVDTAGDPIEGLEKLTHNTYDCVLVDFEMPGIDGPQVCRRIREMGDAANPQVVLIILSSHEGKDHMKLGFDAGADDYISKSTDSAVVRARLGALLRRKFLVEQNRGILRELQERELQTVRAQAAREAAEMRATLADQLAAANEQLANANTKLDLANRELEQFASSAAHDLQEPLRMISIYSELLRREYSGKLDDRADEMIGFCVEGAQRMDQLIKDLLAYARAAGTGQESRSNVDLNCVVQAVLANLEVAKRESSATITADALPTVFVEETHIQQVLQNLLSNAMKYRRPDTPVEIHISAERQGEMWMISVSDNGIGIEPQHLEYVFGLFKRLHRGASSGTGLGLAMCRRIVERHGGRIWAESEMGKGSAFCFTMPNGQT